MTVPHMFSILGAAGAGGGGPVFPATIPGLTLWLDASDTSTISYSSGSILSQWRDKSGNAYHAAPAGSGTNITHGVVTQNGLPTVTNGGSGGKYLDTASFTLAQPFTIFWIWKSAASGVAQSFMSSIGGNLQTFGVDSGAKDVGMFAGSSVIDTNLLLGGTHHWIAIYDGASSVVYQDGSVGTGGNPGTSGTTTGMRIGAERNLANAGCSGSFCEIIAFSGAADSTMRTDLDSYSLSKWAI
jgi:hypothetical protein